VYEHQHSAPQHFFGLRRRRAQQQQQHVDREQSPIVEHRRGVLWCLSITAARSESWMGFWFLVLGFDFVVYVCMPAAEKINSAARRCGCLYGSGG
jgi:hypothetical protein